MVISATAQAGLQQELSKLTTSLRQLSGIFTKVTPTKPIEPTKPMRPLKHPPRKTELESSIKDLIVRYNDKSMSAPEFDNFKKDLIEYFGLVFTRAKSGNVDKWDGLEVGSEITTFLESKFGSDWMNELRKAITSREYEDAKERVGSAVQGITFTPVKKTSTSVKKTRQELKSSIESLIQAYDNKKNKTGKDEITDPELEQLREELVAYFNIAFEEAPRFAGTVGDLRVSDEIVAFLKTNMADTDFNALEENIEWQEWDQAKEKIKEFVDTLTMP